MNPRQKHAPLKKLTQTMSTASVEENEQFINSSSEINKPKLIVNSDMLTRSELIAKIRNFCQNREDGSDPLVLGEGVIELVSSAASEVLYDVIRRVGKAAETRVYPTKKIRKDIKTNSDKVREKLNMKEKGPKEDDSRKDGRIRVSMVDVLQCKKFLPKRSIIRYEIKQDQPNKSVS